MMALSKKQQIYIEAIIVETLRKKFLKYSPESSNMPFHFRLLGQDRMALFSFIQSLNTTFGTSIFEPVAVALAQDRFKKVEAQYIVGNSIYKNCQQTIQEINNKLTTEPKPNKLEEIDKLRKSLTGTINILKSTKVDLFVETISGDQYLFDLKTAKPNKGEFQKFKQTLLEWAGIALTQDSNKNIHTLIAIPYNPYYPAPYQRWTMAGMLDLSQELFVAEEFWDFLGGEGAYSELLNCFEKAGVILRPEIDEYFAKFIK
ncbi:MAG: TdeIII family type II restriction endonuclease [Deferribacteraceae bacterium]|jgi:type II restriction enzyme|nr:TdeIII family type II restriction endonuclease [Deferribacteraceae bacterium]